MNAMLFDKLKQSVVSPYDELMAYEFLYAQRGMTLKRMSEETVGAGRLPSELMDAESGLFDARDSELYHAVSDYIDGKIGGFDLAVNGTPSWPESLADSARPAPILYFRGSISLMRLRSFSVVGSRKATEEGKDEAARLARDFVDAGAAVVTGLAAGIDTAATKAALRYGDSKAVGVMGTPIDECYPKENRPLVAAMLEEGCLIVSQVPFYRYKTQPFGTRRYYFPERNELMAAISDATVIVEASDTSGTLTLARACAHQGRPLFIMRRCYEDRALLWPRKWAERENVYVVGSASEVMEIMESNGFYRDCHE